MFGFNENIIKEGLGLQGSFEMIVEKQNIELNNFVNPSLKGMIYLSENYEK